MKKIIVIGLLIWAAWWVGTNYRMGPLDGVLEQLPIALFQEGSEPYSVFQDFATAMVRGAVDQARSLAEHEAAKAQVGRTFLALREWVREVHHVTYTLESEDASPDGHEVTLSVTQTLTIDPVGIVSSFGTLTCEGTYGARMITTDSGWKLASFAVGSLDARACRKATWMADRIEWVRRLLGRTS